MKDPCSMPSELACVLQCQAQGVDEASCAQDCEICFATEDEQVTGQNQATEQGQETGQDQLDATDVIDSALETDSAADGT